MILSAYLLSYAGGQPERHAAGPSDSVFSAPDRQGDALIAEPPAPDVICSHEPYQGYCAHCNAPYINGRAVIPPIIFPSKPGTAITGELTAEGGNEALQHLRNVLYGLGNLHPDDRCEAYNNALVYYNTKCPNQKIEPEEGFSTRLVTDQPSEISLVDESKLKLLINQAGYAYENQPGNANGCPTLADIVLKAISPYLRQPITGKTREISLTQDFKCKAKSGFSDPPQECDWPLCGCDPYADKVIGALQECGYLRQEPVDLDNCVSIAFNARASGDSLKEIIEAVLTAAGVKWK